MTNQCSWMVAETDSRPKFEVARRHSRPPIDVSGDVMGGGAHPAAVLRDSRGGTRVHHESVMEEAVDECPDEDRIAAPGLVLTVYHDDTAVSFAAHVVQHSTRSGTRHQQKPNPFWTTALCTAI